MSGESEKTLRETFEEAAVGYAAFDPSEQGLTFAIETSALYPVHRRDRCNHTEKRERPARDGETHSGAATNMHGWSVLLCSPQLPVSELAL